MMHVADMSSKTKLLATIAIILALYLVSFGPIQMWIHQSSLESHVWFRRSNYIVYYPHYWLAAKWEPYFNYTKWWCLNSKTNYDRYQRWFDTRYWQ